MEYLKLSEDQFKLTETKQVEKVFNVQDLKADRVIYLAEIAEYQAKIDAIDAILGEAVKVGIDIKDKTR